MGLRGPAPKPTALRLVEGTGLHHPMNQNQPKPKAILPTAPVWMWEDEIAMAEWKEITKTMGEVPGWLTRVNKGTLAGHCHWWAEWTRAIQALKTYGSPTYENAYTGQKKPYPEVKISHDAWASMMKCDQELGITPARGSSVHLPARSDEHDESGLDPQRTGS